MLKNIKGYDTKRLHILSMNSS